MESRTRMRVAKGADSRFRRRLLFKVWVGVAGFLLIPCGGAIAKQTSASQAALPRVRELTDEIGRKVHLPQKVNRVVSLAPNLTEIVFALGGGDRLAGDTTYCDYPPEAQQKPHVGGPINPSLEQIAALMPDVVLATSINRRETVGALDRIGLPVFVTDPHSVEEMIETVQHVGSALGLEKSATEVAGDLHARLADLDRRLARAPVRRVFFIVWTEPLISVGSETFIADALRRAGGSSVVDTKTEWPHVSLEEVVHLQPELLVFASDHLAETRRDIEMLRTRPGWKDLTAMQQGKILVVSDAINRPAPRMVDTIEQLAHSLHPEAFALRSMPAANFAKVEEAHSCAL